jgi:hypothetical protein
MALTQSVLGSRQRPVAFCLKTSTAYAPQPQQHRLHQQTRTNAFKTETMEAQKQLNILTDRTVTYQGESNL